ncbi:NADH:flavin oxidoreductase/NADH oxidase [Sanghuangporus baumii]|uniref:NADH:flavin oxidoreductase/NADH oxidase n=1 Tax=Sanghuangporus baumii TaxID=108892 RepID=A0A9Q5I4W1_SANBA|nr:NADH:flavin oxidoreductase/NADH oxidase [Sanghuangporus baumii]
MPEVLSLPYYPKNPGGPYPSVSSSVVTMPKRRDGTLPCPLEHEKILEYIELFGTAASNAVHRAEFDGVEIQTAHGYLLDQFL